MTSPGTQVLPTAPLSLVLLPASGRAAGCLQWFHEQKGCLLWKDKTSPEHPTVLGALRGGAYWKAVKPLEVLLLGGINIVLMGLHLIHVRVSCYINGKSAPSPFSGVLPSPCDLFHTYSHHCKAICHETFIKAQTDEPAQFQTFSLQSMS